MYIATAEDLQLLKQSVKNIYSRIELLNENFTVIDEIHGYATAGNINVNADSDIRRTCTLTLVLANKDILRGKDKLIWLTKYVRVFIGYQNARTGKIQYYNQGVFAFGENSFVYSAQQNIVDLTCYDMMCNLNGLLDGQMIGEAFRIPCLLHEPEIEEVLPDKPEDNPGSGSGSSVNKPTSKEHDSSCVLYGKTFFGHPPACTCGLSNRSSRIAVTADSTEPEAPTEGEDTTVDIEPERNIVHVVMKDLLDNNTNVERYDLEVMRDGEGNIATLKYDLEYETGTTVYAVFEELATHYDGYEFFFDVEGTFIFQAIPTLDEDECVLTADILEELVVSEQLSGMFSDVRNATEVWGMCHDAEHYADTSTYNAEDNTYSASVTKVQLTDDGKIQNGDTFAVMITETNKRNPKLKINNLDPFPICDEGYEEAVGEDVSLFNEGILQPGNAYTFKFKKGHFIFLGEWQIHAVCLLYNEHPWDREARIKHGEALQNGQMSQEEYNAKVAEYKAETFRNDIIRWHCDYIKYRLVPENPFAIDALGGKVLMQVKSGGEYAKIFSDDEASERAEYDCLMAARYNDTLTLEMHVVPWLEVNQKIQYRVKHSNEVIEWLVKSIDLNLASGCMNITCARFYRMTPALTRDETTRGLKPANE